MGPIAKKVWEMWPSIDEMAADLDESVNALRRAHAKGELPSPKHDRILILKDRSRGGRLTKSKLEAVRAARHNVDRLLRGDLIRGFYARAGGVRAVSERTGVTPTHLRLCTTRGYLNRTAEEAYREIAAELGYDLPDYIFTRPLG